MVLGSKQRDLSHTDESLKEMLSFNHHEARDNGYPMKYGHLRNHPWDERERRKELENSSRSLFHAHKTTVNTLPYGFIVDMEADQEINSQRKYKTTTTGEAFLQVRQSMVVGIGGHSTGNGVFTLKSIPANTWITSYAPLAPVRLAGSHSNHSDYIITTTRNGVKVEIDGSLCPLGIGKLIQDGTFPLFLLPEKYNHIIKQRINCVIADRDGEIWLRSTRTINAGEELLTRYSHNNSYWLLHHQFQDHLHGIKVALQCSQTSTLEEAEAIIRNYKM